MAQIVELLNALFTEFDDLTRKHGLEKVKTIGDAFMVAGGMPGFTAGSCETCRDAGARYDFRCREVFGYFR